jgi:hypothetical protein
MENEELIGKKIRGFEFERAIVMVLSILGGMIGLDHLYVRSPTTFLAKMIELGFTPIETSIISCGFIFPRTISQIINEAHFALEENVARDDLVHAVALARQEQRVVTRTQPIG